ncbi:MAG: 3-isopropylmalate dehydratase small subunit [bacterium]|nr:3-isopropylmalate dehydratase small subunit [bacterium]
MNFKGKSWKYGDNVNTDEIIPARYLNTSDPKELAEHCMEDIDASFAKCVKKGDIIVAQENFGCGSSREHAPISIKEAGVSCIIANTFARIFYRNAINIGLPILECKEAVKDADKGDILEVDLSAGTISNLTKNKFYKSSPFPEFIQDLISAGGLMKWVSKSI